MKKQVFFILCALGALCARAQVTTEPTIVSKGYKGEIIVTFDATKGTGGMKGATQCYAHTGITYNGQSWQKTGEWRDGKEKYKLTKKADNLWELKITPNMFEYYGVPETTDITQICLVFNDGPNGSKEGKATGGRDIFIDLGEAPCEDIWTNFTPAAATTKARPAGIVNGIYYGADGTSVTLCTYAASTTAAAKHVFLLGDMTDWRLSNDYQLYKDGNYFWIELKGLTKGKEYRFQYVVERADGKHVQLSDLFSEKLLHPDDQWEPRSVDPSLMDYPRCGADGGYVTVIQPGKEAYPWSDATLNFKRPNKNNLVIYELWVYDYTTDRSLKGLMKQLDYIQGLGVNAIELMPVCEFDGNYNWGYSPNHYFALDKAYGTPTMYKQFIDECHRRGIAVIMDMVFNHATGLNPMNKLYPYGTELKDNPWFNVTAPHGDNVYEDWNHDFAPAQDMFDRALKYWLTEYKVDGFRMDLSHGFCGKNCSCLKDNLVRMQKAIQSVSPDAYFIQEYWGSNPSQSTLVNLGMMCWSGGSGLSNAYSQIAMGWLDKEDAIDGGNAGNGYVTYCESHDEERNFYKVKTYGNGDLKTNEAARLHRVPMVRALNLLLNGPHLMYQFGELGYDYSINSSSDNQEIKDDNRCSKKVNPASMGWLSSGSSHMKVYDQVAKVIKLRTQYMPKVFEGNPTATSLGHAKEVRTVQWGNNVFVAGNVSATNTNNVTIPAGTWYDYMNDNAKVTGTTKSLAPGDLLILVKQPPVNLDPVSSTKTAPHALKVMENGKLVIRCADAVYDFTGTRIH